MSEKAILLTTRLISAVFLGLSLMLALFLLLAPYSPTAAKPFDSVEAGFAPSAAPHLQIQKWADDDPAEGGNFMFHVQYVNQGDADAENVTITDTLQGGMTYLSDTSGLGHTGSGAGPPSFGT